MYEDFIATYGPFAEQIAKQTGQDPATVLGLIAQETSYGTHVAGNNVFGISPGGKVAGYPNIEAAGQAYVGLMQQPRYKGVSGAKGSDAQVFALQQAGYNTVNPAYAVQVGDKIRVLQKAGYMPNAPSVDDLLAARKAGAPQSTDQSTTTNDSSAPSVDELLKQRGTTATTSDAGSDTSQNTPPASFLDRTIAGIPGGLYKFGVGLAQGAKQIIDPQAEWLARHLGDNALTRAVGMPSSQEVTAADLAAQQAYDKQYGDSTYARAGNLTGQGLAIAAETNPIMRGGLGLAAGLRGEQLVAAAPTALKAANPLMGIPAQMPVTGAISQLPAMPWAARAAILGSNAVQGAAGAALTGGNPAVGAAIGAAVGPVAEFTKFLGGNLDNKVTRAAIDLGGPSLAAHLGLINNVFEFMAASYGVDKARYLIIPVIQKIIQGGSSVAQQAPGPIGAAGSNTLPNSPAP